MSHKIPHAHQHVLSVSLSLSFLRIILHALLNPLPRLRRHLIHLLRRQLRRLKRRVLVWHITTLFEARPLEKRVEPLFDVRELVQRDASIG